ncbi:MAG: gliding motility lipoprotein GldD [Flavobacteriaceae bacterium]|nr:gliding motility lipoprotein GldD [Flavobacteriaceae bacterium]
MNLLKILFILILITSVITSCKEDVIPKPKAHLRLEYKTSNYMATNTNCPYNFEAATEANIQTNEKCWMNIEYPKLKASINITYRPIENNLKELFLEAEKLTFNHAIKADGISSVPYKNEARKIYGAIFEVTGNAASPIQFHVTDSTKNFITGAVYFNIKPNYDSIKPAINHLHKDIIHLIESLNWKE